jgi:hypothetical protein
LSEGWSKGEGWGRDLVLVVVVDNRPATTALLCLGRRGPQGAAPSLYTFILTGVLSVVVAVLVLLQESVR